MSIKINQSGKGNKPQVGPLRKAKKIAKMVARIRSIDVLKPNSEKLGICFGG